MLGYVKTDTQELRVREQQYYRAIYCGLCHRMGKCTGNCSRVTLSYDFVFLATLRMALAGERPEIRKQRCFLHPFRARPTLQKSPSLDYCADASALLVYHKLADDLHDERGFKKWRSQLMRPFLHSAYKRARKRCPDLDDRLHAHLSRLSDMETHADEHFGADCYAEVFGELLSDVVSYRLDGTDQRIAQTMGRAVGRWIYLIDAADDFEEDRKKGRFNPYLQLFGKHPTDADWETVDLSLTVHLCDAERGFELIDSVSVPEQKEILANILFLGLPKITKELTIRKNGDSTKSDTKDS